MLEKQNPRSLRAFPEMIRRRSGEWRKSPRWSAERRARQARFARRAPRLTRGSLAPSPARQRQQDAPFGAPPTLRFGVSEGKWQDPDANAPRERDDLGCLTS